MMLLWMVCLLLPTLVMGLRIKYDPLVVHSGALIYQGFYMYDKKSSPRSGPPGNGESFIEMVFNMTKHDKNSFAYGDVEAIIASDKFFSALGYMENGKQMVCCDAKAIDMGVCTMEGKLIIPESLKFAFPKVDEKMNNRDTGVFVHYDIPKEGKYYIILALCDPTTTNLEISGESLVVNPYGHIPASLYRSIPFYAFLLFFYSGLFVVWLLRCMKYSDELMNIHYFILVTIILFIVDYIVTLTDLNVLNRVGYLVPLVNFVSVVMDSLARSVARGLMLSVCLGMGVSKPSLGSSTMNVVIICSVYFVVSVWNAMSNSITSATRLSLYRLLPSSIVDSIIYFWILQALMDTIQELDEKKQTSKLGIFRQLRNIVVICAICAVTYNILFSFFLFDQVIATYWQYQWFFTDGIWSCFYCILFTSIIYLWSPSDHSLAYASHVQVATDDNEYGAEIESLQDDNDMIRVATLSGNQF
ncbi:hypothetical protein WA538_001381, partial [Blastocystis sp. DL]